MKINILRHNSTLNHLHHEVKEVKEEEDDEKSIEIKVEKSIGQYQEDKELDPIDIIRRSQTEPALLDSPNNDHQDTNIKDT